MRGSLVGGAVGLVIVIASTDDAKSIEGAGGGLHNRPTVTCETRLQVVPRRGPSITRRMRRHAVQIGGVYFLGARYYADVPRSDLDPGPGRTMPVKTPLVVPTGPPAEITLVGSSRCRSAIEVGLDQAPYRVRADGVALEPCGPGAEVAGRRVGSHTPFNGGFRVSKAQCLRLGVEIEGQGERIGRLALGRHTCRSSFAIRSRCPRYPSRPP